VIFSFKGVVTGAGGAVLSQRPCERGSFSIKKFPDFICFARLYRGDSAVNIDINSSGHSLEE
jgi:hypothetical protein